MKQALLAVSFGTSVPRARQDIEAVERVLAAGAPERAFCRAYTSPTIDPDGQCDGRPYLERLRLAELQRHKSRRTGRQPHSDGI